MANANFTCELHAWREGTTLKAYMEYRRTDGATYFYQDASLPTPTMNLGGVSYQDTAFADAVHNGVNIGSFTSTTFSRTVGGSGARTVTWSCGSGIRSDFAGDWSQTVTFPGSGPSGGSITNVSTTEDSITATLTLTSWGTSTSNAHKRLCVLELGHYITTPGEPQYYDQDTSSTLSTTHTVTNQSSTANNPTWTIQPNTSYNIGIYAETADGDYRYNYPNNPVTTRATAPTVSLASVTNTSATISYSAPADGGALSKTIEYSLDGTTWVTGATVSTGAATSGTFTVSSLTAGTTYNIQTRVTTTAGSTTGATVTATTSGGTANAKLYGSHNGETKLVKKLYGSHNGQTVLIEKLYGSHNGETKLVYEA